MDNSKINKAADILYNSRINLKKIKELPKDCTPKSIQEAYAIQDELTKKYISEKEKILHHVTLPEQSGTLFQGRPGLQPRKGLERVIALRGRLKKSSRYSAFQQPAENHED